MLLHIQKLLNGIKVMAQNNAGSQLFDIEKAKMFGLFKKKTEREKLEELYRKLTEEAYRLSHTNRQASDLKTVEAHEVLLRLEALPKN